MTQRVGVLEETHAAAADTIVTGLFQRITRMADFYARCSRVERDDLLQEGWLATLEAIPEFNPELGPLKPYLVRCARWRMLDCIKRAGVRRVESLEESGEAAQAQWTFGGGDAESEEFAATLNPLQQQILRCLMNGLTWRDTGACLGFSSANVAYHMREIRRKFALWNEADCRLAESACEST